MPSGACVRLTSAIKWSDSTYMNVYIDGIPEDKNELSGTCGNFNGDPEDDIWKKGTNDVLTGCHGCVPREYYQTWK